jgi:hypothetical protein
MMAQTFSRFFIVVDYQLNKDYIAKNLCINKDKPKMQCNGKCHMMKKLAQEEKKDQENPERRSENKFEAISFHDHRLNLTCNHTLPAVIYPETHVNVPSRHVETPFHPPRI